MSVDIPKLSAAMRRKVILAAQQIARGHTWEQVGAEQGVAADTARHWKARYPDVFDPAYLEALAISEAELVPLAIAAQREVLEDSAADYGHKLKASADARTEHGRGLDRLLKQTETLKVIIATDIAAQVDAAVQSARSFAREGEEDACERSVRAAFAA